MLAHVRRSAHAEVRNGPFQCTNAGGGHRALEHLREGHAVEPTGVGLATRAARVGMVVGAVGAVLGHKSALHRDVMAARGAQAQHVEVLDDFEVGLGQQEGAVLHLARAVLLGQDAAQEDPLTVLDAAAPAPVAAEAVATLHLLGLARGHVGGGDQRRRVLGPDVLLRLLGEQRQLPVVHPDNAVDPGRGHAALGQRHLHGIKHAGVHLVAAPALRLQHLEEARLLHLQDGLTWNQAVVLGLRRTLHQARNHVAGAADQLTRLGGQPVVHRLRRAFEIRASSHVLLLVGLPRAGALVDVGIVGPEQARFIVRSD